MKRREFVQRTAAIAGAAAVSINPAKSSAQGITELIPQSDKAKPRADAPPPITEAEREQRREKARTLLKQLGFSAMLIEPGANMDYFAGINWGRSERLFAFLLPVTGRPVVISPAFEQQRAEDQVAGRYDVRVWQEDQNPEALVAQTLKDLGAATGRLAIDPSARLFVLTELVLARPGIEVGNANLVVNQCRGVKSPHEVEIMRFANQTTLAAYREAFKSLRVGMTQAQLAATVSAEMKKLGYDGGALVLFGESSAYPHGLPHPRALEENQVVLVDGGLNVHGYQSDMTRTVVFGTPAPEMQKVFDIVHEAQARALATAAPGKKAGDVDAAARKVITDAGYGPDYRTFTHRLGHGIGLEGHEWPYFVRGSTVILEPRMTFSDEPGIYQYGKFGIRLEDILAITENGAEMMTPRQSSLRAADL
jgi:Xaa-Pro dipeptidase